MKILYILIRAMKLKTSAQERVFDWKNSRQFRNSVAN